MRRGGLLATLALAAVLAGCKLLLGVDDPIGDEGNGGNGGDAGAPLDGGGAPESCFNGVDDDRDGKVDCDDDDCALAARCAPILPEGWSAGLLLTGSNGVYGTCDAGFTEVARGGVAIAAADAKCNGCTCTPSINCQSIETVDTYATATCTQKITTLLATPGDCMSTLTMTTSAELAPDLSMGVCEASGGGIASKTDPIFTTTYLACAFVGPGACSERGLCLPGPSADELICAFHAGDVECPIAYPNRIRFDTAFEDQRDCAACACGPDIGGACTASLRKFTDGNCAAAAGPPLGPGCHSGNFGSFIVDVTPGVGTCPAPTGGTPTGSVTSFGPFTACCLT